MTRKKNPPSFKFQLFLRVRLVTSVNYQYSIKYQEIVILSTEDYLNTFSKVIPRREIEWKIKVPH